MKDSVKVVTDKPLVEKRILTKEQMQKLTGGGRRRRRSTSNTYFF